MTISMKTTRKGTFEIAISNENWEVPNLEEWQKTYSKLINMSKKYRVAPKMRDDGTEEDNEEVA